MTFYFFDDNKHPFSKRILFEFAESVDDTIILVCNEFSKHVKNEYTHYWNAELVNKVADLKNKILDYARLKKYDYLFLNDSDIMIHPETINQLLKDDKPIVSNIFWITSKPGYMTLPQVWLRDEYTNYLLGRGERITKDERLRRVRQFLNQLRIPVLYEVGGLGSCTWINHKVLDSCVSFDYIYNVSFFGEDRYFCIRAVAMGFPLYVDTHLPAYHIYRLSDLSCSGKYFMVLK